MMSGRVEKWRSKLYAITFGTDTAAGRVFDIVLLVLILLSVLTVSLESVPDLHRRYGVWFMRAEWGFTVLFSIEYLIRIYSSPRPLRYTLSFFGLVDLFAVVPTYLSFIVAGSQYLLVLRVLRLLRVARIFKLTRFINEGQVLTKALRASMIKILVFLGTVLTMVVIIGSVMYLIEGAKSGFTSVPVSIYWAIVTLTTVGYGDIAPATALGQILASMVMIMGYGIIAVPTGIVSVEIAKSERAAATTRLCSNCYAGSHLAQARFCYNCGHALPEDKAPEKSTKAK